ncbi:16680_t:CDS:10 [Funneliformis geosporum]|nr:16680_t:CDS:10 [Funneliformis geosporum]
MGTNPTTYLAASPNGILAATFNSETYEIRIYDVEKLEPYEIKDADFNLESQKGVEKLEHQEINTGDVNLNEITIDLNNTFVPIQLNPHFKTETLAKVSFSLAISNYDKDGHEAFVALSRFYDEDMKKSDNSDSTNENKENLSKKDNPSETFIYSKKKPDVRIGTNVNKCGGIVKFLNTSANLIVMNASGISKGYINHNKSFYINKLSIEEEYEFPTTIQIKIKKFFQQKPSSENPMFSISRRNHLLAYCNETNYITIHLMENGLKIAKKEFDYSERILSFSFIDNDERLLVVTEIGRNVMINIWDLFTFNNDIRSFVDESNIFSSLQMSINTIAFSCGKILATLDETIRSVLVLSKLPNDKRKPQDLTQISNNQISNKKEPWSDNKQHYQHFYLNDEESVELIIGETTIQVWRTINYKKEQVLKHIWVIPSRKILNASLKYHDKTCEFYLEIRWNDSNDETYYEFHLERPWNDDSNDQKKEMKIYINCTNETHVLKDACVAMKYINDRRHEIVGPNNLKTYNDLVKGIEDLIKKCIEENHNLWSLTEVRYGIMANIIRSKNLSLLHWILFDYEKETEVSNYLHIPSQYKLVTETIDKNTSTTSDLTIAIKLTLGGLRRDKAIVAMLLEYYSNNAEKDTGWMFTVTKALPLLNNHQFKPYLKELLYKPCFGSKEEHVDSKFVCQIKLEKGYKSEICSLNVKPRLLLKNWSILKRWSFWKHWSIWKLKPISSIFEGWSSWNKSISNENENNAQIATLRLVPLPDFTVYPANADIKINTSRYKILLGFISLIFIPRRHHYNSKDDFSSFISLIKNNDCTELEKLCDNPAMEACIDFKWNAAKNYFYRHLLLFMAFSFMFALVSGIIPDVDSSDRMRSLFSLLFFYLGYYLLAKEMIQLFHDGWWGYKSIYHFFDVVSIIIAIAAIYSILQIRIFFNDESVNVSKVIVILQAFAVLILWFELILLTRYIKVFATYIRIIINIIKKVVPFLFFMLIMTVAFGHAMHIILKDPKRIGLEPSGDSFVINSPADGMTLTQEFDIDKPIDNYYVSFPYAVMGVYFWNLGRWDQLEVWDFWPIHVFSIGASILLVIIMQNLLIAFMTGVYDVACQNGKLAVLGYRVGLIANYETLQKPSGNFRGNPRYIYYVGNTEYQAKWQDKAEEYRKSHKLFSFDDIFTSRITIEECLEDIENVMRNGVVAKYKSLEEYRSLDDDIKEMKTMQNDIVAKYESLENYRSLDEDIKEMKTMQIDIAAKYNSLDKDIKELLSLVKSASVS